MQALPHIDIVVVTNVQLVPIARPISIRHTLEGIIVYVDGPAVSPFDSSGIDS